MKNKKVLVIGMGKSGIATVNALFEIGSSVYAYDGNIEKIDEKTLKVLKNKCIEVIDFVEDDLLEKIDLIVISPGVPTDIEICKRAKKIGKKIIGELELSYIIGKAKFIGITGTNGKTTTTTLVGEMFKKANINCDIVGNIGKPVSEVSLSANESKYFVTEISSFQLETIESFKVEVGVVLNLTPDHLDRHGSMNNYAEAKMRIFENMTETDYAVINKDDSLSPQMVERYKKPKKIYFSKMPIPKGVCVEENLIKIKYNEREINICKTSDLKIRGEHNLENALAAVTIAYCCNIEVDVIAEVLKQFEGVEHRLESCGEVRGVEFINDSKGTNTDASIKAIEAIKENIILIAGGYDKGSDFKDFIRKFDKRVKAVILIGETASKIKKQCDELSFKNYYLEKNMKKSVEKSFEIAEKGDKVLLSPACASWDMYKSYEVRGKDFKNEVENLKKRGL